MRRKPTVSAALRAAFVLVAVLLALPGQAELYEWMDDDGRVHYSNEPRPGSNPVGLAPIALPPEGEAAETPTDVVRRERLKRQRAERWVDRQDEFQGAEPGEAPDEPTAEDVQRPAAPVEDPHALRDRKCQSHHGMSCLQFEAWLQVNGYDCEPGREGDTCRDDAKVEIHKKARSKAREQLEREDAARAERWKPGIH